jgi:hypothetical protein
MKKIIILTVLALILLFSLGGQALAAPPAQGGEGILVFAEYGTSNLLYWPTPDYDKVVGVGYAFGLGDVGVQVVLPPAGSPDQLLYGAFVGLNLGPVAVNADTLYSQAGNYYGDVAAALLVNLKVVKLGLGAGAEYMFDTVNLSYRTYAQASVTVSALEKLSIYAEAKYMLDSLDLFYTAGFSMVF